MKGNLKTLKPYNQQRLQFIGCNTAKRFVWNNQMIGSVYIYNNGRLETTIGGIYTACDDVLFQTMDNVKPIHTL